MKKYKIAFQMTQSMFCSLPFPSKEWDETCRPYMLIFLPMIGLEIGFLWVLIDWLTNYFAIPALIRGLILCGWPYVVTGFLHLDGFMDVVDAVCSWRDLEKRRAILKDSHVGSFAVVWCVFLILAGFAMFSAVPAATAAVTAMHAPSVRGKSAKPASASPVATRHRRISPLSSALRQRTLLKRWLTLPATVLAVRMKRSIITAARRAVSRQISPSRVTASVPTPASATAIAPPFAPTMPFTLKTIL